MSAFQNLTTPYDDEEDHQKIENGKDFSKIPLSTEMEKHEHDHNHMKNFLISYFFASLATLIKTIGSVSFLIMQY